MSFNYNPQNLEEEITQNIKIITTTRRGSQPMDRKLGLDANILDMPSNRGKALLTAEIFDVLPTQEPRVNIKAVDVLQTKDGQFNPVINYEVLK